MNYLHVFIAALLCTFIACSKEDLPTSTDSTEGYNMLLIGNSFFKPYAEQLDAVAFDAGFTAHRSTVIKRGGDNGRPINFWNDSTSTEHLAIKAALDQGGLDYFGMTSGHDTLNNTDRIEGHRSWINYALQNNPEIKVFIAIPPIDFPASWDSTATAYGFSDIDALYHYFVNDIVHRQMIDQLRAEFPSTTIFSIPTGWAAVELSAMQQDSTLSDNISLFGPKSSAIFTDAKGHQGQIVIEAGTLVWLNSLYKVDLSTNNYATGFNTDLQAIATSITNTHDSNYQQ
jgi:hypothetical protein